MQGFKVNYDKNWDKRAYVVGEVRELENPDSLSIFNYGFHFQTTLHAAIESVGLLYAPAPIIVYEVEALGDIDKGDPLYNDISIATNKIKIIRIVPPEEYSHIIQVDKNGNVVFFRYMDGYWFEKEYNDNNQITIIRDDGGINTEYYYDDFGRKTVVDYGNYWIEYMYADYPDDVMVQINYTDYKLTLGKVAIDN